MSAPREGAAGWEQSRYYRRMELAIVLALAIHAAGILLAPPYVARPYKLDSSPLRLVAAGHRDAGTFGAAAAAAAPAQQAGSHATVTSSPRLGTPIITEQFRSVPPSPATHGGRAGAGGREGPQGAPGGEGLDPTGEDTPPVFYAFDSPPRVLDRVVPEYPVQAKAQGAEGSVVLNANVDERGRVIRVWVAKSTAPETLVEAAMDALYRFQFAPGSQQGVPVRCTVAVPFNFSLNVHF